MKRLSKPHKLTPDFDWNVDSPARAAKYRMLYLPTDESRDLKEQFLFVSSELWVVCLPAPLMLRSCLHMIAHLGSQRQHSHPAWHPTTL